MATMTEEIETMHQVPPEVKNEVLPYAPKFVLQTLPASLPTCQFEADLDFEALAAPLGEKLAHLSHGDFSVDAIWRDTFALTGSLRTFYSARSIVEAWSETFDVRRAVEFKIVPGSANPVRLGGEIGWVDCGFNFRLEAPPAARCKGFVSLVLEDGEWKIWVLRTVLEQLEGFGDVDYLSSKATATNGTKASNGRPGHAEIYGDSKSAAEAKILDCVIVGGGQGGLSCGGRLQALGVDYVILEKHSRIGDNWATRYDSAKLHIPREYNHLPFNRTFPDTYSEFLTKDELAEGYKNWAHEFGVDEHVWLESSLDKGSWDPAKQLWTLYVSKSGIPQTITSRTVIMAIGPGGQIPTMPTYPGQDEYKGEIIHSVDYKSAKQWKGLAGIVIGTANTAHDVAKDMVEAGLSITTMVQRTRTHVLPWEYFAAVIKNSYNATSDIVASDRASFSMPSVVSRLVSKMVLDQMASADQERFDALERAGFKCARFGEIQWHILERLGGHYIDVGCSKMIADGLIKMKAGPVITKFTSSGVAFSDGTEITADVVVFCTGFVGNIRNNIEQIFGEAVSDAVGDFWGLDEEGEVKGAFRRTGHQGMWCIGGTIPGCRYFSRHVALQIKAQVMGSPLPIYEDVKHRRRISSVH